MSDDLKNILNNSNKDIDNQKLMDYLSKQLSKQDSHDLEKMMADDEFMNDAVEGLEQFNNVKKLPLSVEQLNRDLQKQLAKKKSRKEKRKIKNQPWVYFTIILVLLVTVICFVIVKKYMDDKKPGIIPKVVTAQVIQPKKHL
jgi:t-SNARE complex subunit (syntaxin)